MSDPVEPYPKSDELVEADDRRIGAAFGRSLWVLGALALIGFAAFGLSRVPRAPVQVKETVVEAPRVLTMPPAEVPPAQFTDVTHASGIDFVHHNGAYGDKLLPETMGGGVAVIDVRNNGRADLLFVDSGNWPWKPVGPQTPTLRLY